MQGGKKDKEGKFKNQSSDQDNAKNDKTKNIKKQNRKWMNEWIN